MGVAHDHEAPPAEHGERAEAVLQAGRVEVVRAQAILVEVALGGRDDGLPQAGEPAVDEARLLADEQHHGRHLPFAQGPLELDDARSAHPPSRSSPALVTARVSRPDDAAQVAA